MQAARSLAARQEVTGLWNPLCLPPRPTQLAWVPETLNGRFLTRLPLAA